ncbi:type II toxin-antitoxin system PemI/MazE family antitoxin [Enterococcus faecalis]|uniref:type II toxin-antitoxin system PemI/MazE family antitoxin n=1 Tax=Enterococcus faecalis TaxID=1351 RepID=UPI0013866BF4|nr:AbrB/MazE/SpoVT family DNA-binding domain-containing protein [Enterococcus faecalis]EHA3993913.1 AbrB/MazE/SpoVT family DNA-binding domain-containing protein [Enterococcus faecalis]EHM3062033.1 AbrB/MazE/SpoVT family DNA-binding domain-containing protein [Enterococcus faecalis]EHQ8839843.1 AbrB/MazE/SpoVT family DNA-binding domain-containing protein [Enterococcus faecalis]EIB6796242.1 AbrB/MazE/SpoVT family DNA-binding domain-containing protein [Enterococcus faecalis]EIR3706962.1 AbrB/MazE/
MEVLPMTSTKTRKQGNSLVITIPATLGIKEGEEFVILRKNNGSIALIPKVEDFFENASEGEFYLPELAIDYSPSGGEIDGI